MAKWPIVGYDGSVQQHGIVNHYAAFGGFYFHNTTEANAQQEVRDTYTASNLRIYISSWIGGAGVDDMIAAFRVNGADGNQTLTINSTGEHEDTSNTDSLTSGNLINVHFDHSAGGHNDEYTVETYQVTLDAGSNVPPVMAASVWFTNTTRYASLLSGLAPRSTESEVQYTMRATRTLRDMRVYAYAHSVNATITMMKNGGQDSLTVGVTGTGEFLDTSNTDSFVAGDEVDYEAFPVGNTSLSVRSVEADTSSGLLGGSDDIVSSSTEFFPANGYVGVTTEAEAETEAEDNATIQNLFVNCFTYAETRTIRTRKNQANGAASVSVSGTGLFEDTSNTDTLAAEDDLSIQQDAGSSGTNGYLVAVEWETAVGVDVSDPAAFTAYHRMRSRNVLLRR